MSRGLERAAYDLDEYLIFSDIRPKRLNERFPACSSGYRPRAGEPEFLYGALAASGCVPWSSRWERSRDFDAGRVTVLPNAYATRRAAREERSLRLNLGTET